MSLSAARVRFTRCLGKLLVECDRLGLEVVADELKRHELVAEWNATHCRVYVGKQRCERTQAQHGPNEHDFRPIGIRESTHRRALAIDLYILEGGRISNDREKYAQLGAYWKGLDPELRWGGDFEGFPDLGHFSHEWQGRQ